MTKSPRSDRGLRLFSICRWLLLAVLFKLGILASLFWDLPLSSVDAILSPKTESQAELHVEAPIQTVKADEPQMLSLASSVEAVAAQTPASSQQAAPGSQAASSSQASPSSQATPSSQTASSSQASPGAPLTSSASLLQRQEELNQREHDLRQLESQIDQKLTELQNTQNRLQDMLKEAQATRDEKLRHLVDVYTNMKARQAAQVIETLDEAIAVKILSNMRGRQAGEILTYVKPEIAAKLSEALTKVQLPLEY